MRKSGSSFLYFAFSDSFKKSHNILDNFDYLGMVDVWENVIASLARIFVSYHH